MPGLPKPPCLCNYYDIGNLEGKKSQREKIILKKSIQEKNWKHNLLLDKYDVLAKANIDDKQHWV